jgi:hypothetical protein
MAVNASYLDHQINLKKNLMEQDMSTTFATHHLGHVALDWSKALGRLAAFVTPRETGPTFADLPAELRRLPPHLLADIGVDPRFKLEDDVNRRGTAPGL